MTKHVVLICDQFEFDDSTNVFELISSTNDAQFDVTAIPSDSIKQKVLEIMFENI